MKPAVRIARRLLAVLAVLSGAKLLECALAVRREAEDAARDCPGRRAVSEPNICGKLWRAAAQRRLVLEAVGKFTQGILGGVVQPFHG